MKINKIEIVENNKIKLIKSINFKEGRYYESTN